MGDWMVLYIKMGNVEKGVIMNGYLRIKGGYYMGVVYGAWEVMDVGMGV